MDLNFNTNINVKRCYIIAVILLILEIIMFFGSIWFITTNPMFTQPDNKSIPHLPNGVVLIALLLIMIVIPTIVVVLFGWARTPKRIEKHIRYLKATNPKLDFMNLKKKDINHLVGQLDFMANNKTSFLSMGTKAVVTTINTKQSRYQYYQDHLHELKELHPEIDFNNMSKRDKEIINDELDAMIYAEQ